MAQDDFNKVACSSVVGDGAETVSIQTRVGSTEFDDATIEAADTTSDSV